MKKTFGLIVLLFTLFSLVSAGASGTQDSADGSGEKQEINNEITVIFPQHEADKIGAYPALVKEFTKETGIKVNLIQLGWDEVADKVLPELASGGSAYDVVEFDNGWVAKWTNAGWVEPLDNYMPVGYEAEMIPGLVDLFSGSDDKLYGVVWNNDTRFFYYNKSILDEAGIAAPPTTWDELIEQSKMMQDRGLIKYGLAPFWKAEWALANEFHFWTYTYGGRIVDGDGNFLWNKDSKTLAAVNGMKRLLDEGVADPASLTYDQETSMNLFLKGETAFMPQGLSGLLTYADNPEISSVVGEIAVSTVPGASADLSAALTLPEAYAIPKASKNKENAWKFIEFMTSKESNKKLSNQIGTLPIWVDVFSDSDLLEKYPHWLQFQQQLVSVQGLSTLSWYDDFADKCITEIQTSLSGRQSAEEALAKMADLLKEFDGVK
ncbi:MULTISPECIES: ABC transporter substrate-binding protein [unclassified Oceanispirochaeta]|uniref:ABC transporter substrate-binding protein n=1 Tax=unclassified Oceanispirochaeta TaxID=2635722 RepID=UPI000E08FC5A|nr:MULTISPECIES: sugar ABC transporter substrate-binding protein [unclassified Oceanispirochaeta]MBF9014632.1 sugar ABC transporter substrate-binding protein [Oceanispirochaeta sp. M2]NPD70888.1 sugar ABC transporter substrate-binding protein [Oceanispirochaeta sp. M1]RDG34168.1 sugar ABC transporter substrate-binding protein [Oceanispirochaeta sp. M1]